MASKQDKIIKGIKAYFKKAGYKKAVVGLSGGVDSALTAVLLAKALGKKNVYALLMPEKGVTLKKNVKEAIKLAQQIGIEFFIQPINRFLKCFDDSIWERSAFARMNAKARIRALLLYDFAASNKALVVGTSNKTELMLGYFTKYGDGACDIEPIGSLYKTEVLEMAKKLDVPQFIIEKTPSAELYVGQTDEAELGRSYAEIDLMLKKKKRMAKDVKKRIESSEHKRRMPVVVSS